MTSVYDGGILMTMMKMATRATDEYSLVIGKLELKMMMTTMTGTSEMRGRLIRSVLQCGDLD